MKEEESIMSSDCSDKEFYQLAKQQRKTKDSSLQFLQVDDKILELWRMGYTFRLSYYPFIER